MIGLVNVGLFFSVATILAPNTAAKSLCHAPGINHNAITTPQITNVVIV
jgi:hypothetical protein